MDSEELEQDRIQELLQLNVQDRELEDEFQEFIEEQEETSQMDISNRNFLQMQELVVIFLKNKNLPFLGMMSSSNESRVEEQASTLTDCLEQHREQHQQQELQGNQSHSPNNQQQQQQQQQEQDQHQQQESPSEQLKHENVLAKASGVPLPVFTSGQIEESILDFNPEEFNSHPMKGSVSQAAFDDSLLADFESLQPQTKFATAHREETPVQATPVQIEQPQNEEIAQIEHPNSPPASLSPHRAQSPEAVAPDQQKSLYPQLPAPTSDGQVTTASLVTLIVDPSTNAQTESSNSSMMNGGLTESQKEFESHARSHSLQEQQKEQEGGKLNAARSHTMMNDSKSYQKPPSQQQQPPAMMMQQQQQSNGFGGADLSALVLPDFPQVVKDPWMSIDMSDLSVIQPGSFDHPSKFISTQEHINLIEQFEKQQQDRDYLNANQYIDCKKVELNKIGKFMKTFVDKNPVVTIQNYKVLEEGFLKGKHVVYTVRVSELNWTAYRRYSDFKMLRDILEKHYPGYFVPPLPRRTLQRKFDKEYLEKRMKILEQFISAVMQSDILKNSQFFEDFLYVQDEMKYRRISTTVTNGPTELNQFLSMDGKINCKESKNFNTYGTAFRNYTINLTDLYQKAKNITKDVTKNLEETQKSMKSLSLVFGNLSKLTKDFNEQNKIGLNTYLQQQYEENSKFLEEYSDVLLKQQVLFKEHIYMKIRYEKKVCQVFEEMSEKRNHLMAVFQDAFQKLSAKKRKLFEKKDFKTWDLPPTMQSDPIALLKDEKLAFKHMLPKETSIIKEMNKKLNFISSNLFYETRKNLNIRESKISNDFILFTTANGELLSRLKDYHDVHLRKLQQVVEESKINIFKQIEYEKNLLNSSVNLTFTANALSLA